MIRFFEWFGLPGAFVLTCLLSIFALLLAIVFRTTDRWLCFAAMLISSCGDVILMNFRNLSDWMPNSFFVGAGVFILAHFVYIAAFAYLIKKNGYKFAGAGLNTAIVVAVAAFIFFTVLTLMNDSFSVANCILSAVYLAVISVDCAVVFTYTFNQAAQGHAWRLVSAVGMLSFFISDCFIGINFLGGIDSFAHLIWWFYPIGQFLLLIGG